MKLFSPLGIVFSSGVLCGFFATDVWTDTGGSACVKCNFVKIGKVAAAFLRIWKRFNAALCNCVVHHHWALITFRWLSSGFLFFFDLKRLRGQGSVLSSGFQFVLSSGFLFFFDLKRLRG